MKANPKPQGGDKPSNIIALERATLHADAPASEEAEQALLGGLLVNGSAYLSVSGVLKDDDFYFLKHQYIWAAMHRLYDQSAPIEALTVGNELGNAKQLDAVGGYPYLVQLLNSTPSSAHVGFYAHIVHRTATRRELLRYADTLKTLARDEMLDVETILNQADAGFTDIRARMARPRNMGMMDGMNAVLDQIESASERATFMSLGHDIGLDDVFGGGLERGRLYVAYARSHHGKTSWAMNVALKLAHQGYQVMFFSTEIPVREVMLDLAALETGYHAQRLRSGALNANDHAKIVQAAAVLSNLPLEVVDAKGLTPEDIYRMCRVKENEVGAVDCVIVDYIQKVHVPFDKFKGQRYPELAYVADRFEHMCRPTHLNTAFIVTAQVNRRVDGQPDKRPTAADIEICSFVEQNADVCIGLYNHGMAEKDTTTPNHFEMLVQKNRLTGRRETVTRRMNPASRRLEPIR